jgi:hypothetical protein
LARQFYSQLLTFEASPEGMRIFYPTMMKNVEIEPLPTALAEARRTRHPQKRRAARIAPSEKLLRQANINSATIWKGCGTAQQVLESDAPTEKHLRSGFVASMKNKREIAGNSESGAITDHRQVGEGLGLHLFGSSVRR